MTNFDARTFAAQKAHLAALQDTILAMPMARTLGLRFLEVAPGAIALEMECNEAFTHQPGQLQATAVFALADFSAAGAAASVSPPGHRNATVDATLKLIAPANGVRLRARGRVVSPGKTHTVCESDVFSVNEDDEETLCATMLSTALSIHPQCDATLQPATGD